MLRSLLLRALVVSSLSASSLAACSREHARPAPPIRPDPPAVSTASAHVDAGPPESPTHATLPGDFDRFDASGGSFAVDIPTTDLPEAIAVFDATTLRETKRRTLRKGAVAWTFGGAIQIVDDGKSLTRVYVDDARSAPIPPTLVASNDDGRGFVSDDGRLFAYGDLTVYDLDAARVAHTFEAPCAGGPMPAAVLAPSGDFVLGACRGYAFAKITGATSVPLAWQYDVAGRHAFSADETILLEGPHYPFAMDWVKTFVVRDVATGKTLRTLPPTITDPDAPYVMTTSAHGDLAAILVKTTLDFYRTSDGKKLGTRPAPEADSTTLAFSPTTGALYVVHEKSLEIVTPPHP